jgi:CheY-like chemotaxis protein
MADSANIWRVVLLEDDRDARLFFEDSIRAHPLLSLTASFETLHAAQDWFRCHSADVLLTDLALPDGSGLQLIEQVAATQPGCEVLVVSVFGDEENVLACVNLPRGDVGAMLASLRYRLQGRIESVGLSLQWRVDRLPPWMQPSDDAMRHLQFMLSEAISNVLQHAQASVLQIEATAADDRIHVCVRDNGCGLGRAVGQDLRSMRERAQLIGADLVVEAAGPGTRVRIGLPAVHN